MPINNYNLKSIGACIIAIMALNNDGLCQSYPVIDIDNVEALILPEYNSENEYAISDSDGLFVMPKKEMDDLLKRIGGDISKIEKELGIPEGEWSDVQIMRFDIDKENINNLRMSSGNEAGANSEWIPGGFTPTGNSEAVINSVEWDNVIQIEISGNR